MHQFLEGHRYDEPKSVDRNHDKQKHEEITSEVGLDEYVEPKGKTASQPEHTPATEADSDFSNDIGQVDERAWSKAVKKGKAGLDHNQSLNSRLLTKKQLTDMAWGVRELSRRLGNIRLKFKARSIFLLTKAYDHELIPKTREVAKWLLSKDRDVRYTVYVEKSLQGNKGFDAPGLLQELQQEYMDAGQMDSNTPKGTLDCRLRYWNENMCHVRPHTFDFIITLGGDGTVLYASWLFQRIVPPVLSFSLGSLGFLTKFDFNEYQDILSTAFRDGMTVSLRLRFEGTIMRTQKKANQPDQINYVDEKGVHHKRDLIEELIGKEREDEHTHRPDGTYEILNEIVVDRGPNPSKSYLQLHQPDRPKLIIGSNVQYRNLRGRRTLHICARRRNMRLDTYGLNSLQSRSRRFTLPSRKPGNARDFNMCAHAIVPTYHLARYDRAAYRSAVRRAHPQLG